MSGKLTPRQKRFVSEYLKDLNATQAAIRAGYAAKDAHVQGPRLLANVSIRNLVAEKTGKQLEKIDASSERVIEEIAAIGFESTDAKTKVADKLKALELLGRYHKLFVERVEHDLSEDIKQGALDLRDILARASDRVARLPDPGRKKSS